MPSTSHDDTFARSWVLAATDRSVGSTKRTGLKVGSRAQVRSLANRAWELWKRGGTWNQELAQRALTASKRLCGCSVISRADVYARIGSDGCRVWSNVRSRLMSV